MVKIILASKSPIRKRILQEADIPFEVMVSDADETPDYTKSYEEQFRDISMRKAKKVFQSTTDMGKRVIVAADQNIMFKGVLYGKPKSIEEARNLIKSMQGSDEIYAYVGNAILYADGDKILRGINNCDISRMRMDNLSEETLERYLANNSPLAKCGGISIEDADFLHLVDGRMSTAKGMTIEYLQELLLTL